MSIDTENLTAAPQSGDVAFPPEARATSEALFREPAQQRTVIEPTSGWRLMNVRELWKYRELLYFLTWRDVKVRYKQTVLGAAWAIIQPVMTMVVFSIFFGKFGGMDKHVEGAYQVFIYAALLPWTFFANSVSQSGQSLISSSNLVSKVYFPRLFIPLSAVGGGLVDFAISLGVMFCLMVGYGVSFSARLLLLPLFTLGTILAAVGVGALLSALVVAYRDFRYVIQFLVQLWMFASPVAYPLDVVPERWRLLYSLNPMVGMISGFRSSILGEPWSPGCLTVSALSTLLLLAAGTMYFRRVERRFADII